MTFEKQNSHTRIGREYCDCLSCENENNKKNSFFGELASTSTGRYVIAFLFVCLFLFPHFHESKKMREQQIHIEVKMFSLLN
jgi:hypothetical protein